MQILSFFFFCFFCSLHTLCCLSPEQLPPSFKSVLDNHGHKWYLNSTHYRFRHQLMNSAQFQFQNYEERRKRGPCCITYTPLGKSRVARWGHVEPIVAYTATRGLLVWGSSKEGPRKTDISCPLTYQNPFVHYAVNGNLGNVSKGCHALLAGGR